MFEVLITLVFNNGIYTVVQKMALFISMAGNETTTTTTITTTTGLSNTGGQRGAICI